jgi:hypothetical protein
VQGVAVFAMAPVALVLTTHLLMQQVGWRRGATGLAEAMPVPQAGPQPARPHTPADHTAQQPASADQGAPAGARARVRAAYEAHVQAGQTPTGAGLARAAGVSERYGQRLLAQFTTDPARPSNRNRAGRPDSYQSTHAGVPRSKGGDHG